MLTISILYLFAEFPRIVPDIPCGHGFSVPKSLKCLYDLDEYQHIKGCRSLAHLQDCGKKLVEPLQEKNNNLGTQTGFYSLRPSGKHSVREIYTPLNPTFI